MWKHLDWSDVEIRQASTAMVFLLGEEEAPEDWHFNVAWQHPNDSADHRVRYRVRPLWKVGDRLRNGGALDVTMEIVAIRIEDGEMVFAYRGAPA